MVLHQYSLHIDIALPLILTSKKKTKKKKPQTLHWINYHTTLTKPYQIRQASLMKDYVVVFPMASVVNILYPDIEACCNVFFLLVK